MERLSRSVGRKRGGLLGRFLRRRPASELPFEIRATEDVWGALRF